MPYALLNDISNLDYPIERLDDKSDDAKIDALKRCLTNSFIGSSSCAPEGMWYWILTGKSCDEAWDKAGEEMEKFMAWTTSLFYYITSPLGGCFALSNAAGEIIGAALCVPNVFRTNLHDIGYSEWIRISTKIGQPVYPSDISNQRAQKLVKLTNAAHKRHAAHNHWFICMVGVAPEYQGRGYGKQLLAFICRLADADNVDVYLETYGARNVKFYASFGFNVVDTIELQLHAGEASGGTYHPMLRKAGNTTAEEG